MVTHNTTGIKDEINTNLPDNSSGLITPAVLRTVEDDIVDTLTYQTINVLQYGAKGDGVTNDTAAFNSALQAAANAGGGIVLVPPATYLVGGTGNTIRFRGANIWLRGSGTSSILKIDPVNITTLNSSPATVGSLIQIGGDGGGTYSNCKISDFAVQDAGYTAVNSGVVSSNFGDDAAIERLYITNASQFAITVSGNRFSIADNVIIKTVQPTTGVLYKQIEAIIVPASTESKNGKIVRNYLEGAGMDICAHDTIISDNIINGHAYGAAITTEQSSFCYKLDISRNTIYSGIGEDVNNTWAGGIENWAKASTITGNRIFNMAGSGIAAGGNNSIYAYNVVYDNSQNGLSFEGIGALSASNPYSANNCIFIGNESFNTVGSTGPQGYGYKEQSSSLSGIILTANNFSTNNSGSLNLLSPTTQGLIISTTVASLPSAIGVLRSFVNNSSVPSTGNFGVIVTSSTSTNIVPVYSDGNNWRIG